MIVVVINRNQNELARTLKHEGLRVGEIIAYRAWRVIHPRWFRSGDDRLHSVLMRDYIWHPDEPASGDVRTHGIYSFQKSSRVYVAAAKVLGARCLSCSLRSPRW